jgi:phosphoribosyl 1,2-cyclic phosphodiesterase
MGMKIKFWGVRGLLPVATPPSGLVNDFRNLFYQFFSQGYSHLKDVDIFLGQQKVTSIGGYGSCSTCVEVTSGKSHLIIDAGSGIKRLGDQIMKQGVAGKGQGVYHILLSHFHIDHLLGLPFFTPIFIPGNEIHFYAVQKELQDAVKFIFTRPYFPVDFASLPSKVVFHQLAPRKTVKVNDFDVTPYLLDHLDPCWGFKISHGTKTYSHCSDTEGTRLSFEDLGADRPLYENVDLMYYDAQYPIARSMQNNMGGHSSSHIGLDLAMKMGVKRILFGHHDPDSTTSDLQNLEKETQLYYISKLESAHLQHQSIHPVQWSFVYEEQTVEL